MVRDQAVEGQSTVLEKQLIEVEKAIKQHIASGKSVADRVENICMVKGLATLSVATVLAETGGFELFTN